MELLISFFAKICDRIHIDWKKCVLFFLTTGVVITAGILLICGFYVIPEGNDVGIARLVHEEYISGGNVADILRVAFHETVNRWLTMGGTYSSYFFTQLEPFVFSEKMIWLQPMFLICTIHIGCLFFVKVILRDILGCTKINTLIAYCGIMTIWVQFVPDTWSAFFWFNGSFYNTITFIVGLIYMSITLKLLYVQSYKNKWYLFTSFICAFFVGGGNFSTALLLDMFFVFVILDMIWKKTPTPKKLLILWGSAWMYIFSFVSFLAPGNMARVDEYSQPSIVRAIAYCFVYAFRHIIELINPAIVVMCLFVGAVIYRNIRNKNYEYRIPLFVIFICLCLYASTYASVSYSMGMMPPIRQVNIQFWFMILLMIFCFIYVFGWLEQKLAKVSINPASINILKENKGNIILIVMLIFCVLAYNPDKLTVALGLKSLSNLPQFSVEREIRSELLNDETLQSVEIKSFSYLPEVFSAFNDLQYQDNKKAWINDAFEMYYHKNIKVLPSDVELEEEAKKQ